MESARSIVARPHASAIACQLENMASAQGLIYPPARLADATNALVAVWGLTAEEAELSSPCATLHFKHASPVSALEIHETVTSGMS